MIRLEFSIWLDPVNYVLFYSPICLIKSTVSDERYQTDTWNRELITGYSILDCLEESTG